MRPSAQPSREQDAMLAGVLIHGFLARAGYAER